MKVSVIVLTYNRAHMITEAIDSVLNQTFKDFELIIVDNYSSDNTESVVKSYVDKRIRYFKNQNNGLIGINRNYGIKKSQGEYVAFLDDDDLWLPEKLKRQVELLDSNREVGLIYSDSYVINGNGDFRENTLFYGRKTIRGDAFSELLQFNFIPMLTVIVRRAVLDKVGGFSLRYKISQDYDLWLRIAECYPIDFIKQPLAKYRAHGENIGANPLIACKEVLEITEYWLRKNPELKRKFGSQFRLKRGLSYCRTAMWYLCRHKNMRAIKEFLDFAKCWLAAKT